MQNGTTDLSAIEPPHRCEHTLFLRRRTDAAFQVGQQTVLQPIDPAMNIKIGAVFPCGLDDRRSSQLANLFRDRELTETIQRLFVSVRAFLTGKIRVSQIPDRLQPVVDDTVRGPVDCRANATTSVVTTDDDVLHIQRIDCKFQNRKQVDVRRMNEIGDITVNEYFAWLQTGDDICRDAAIGTTDP